MKLYIGVHPESAGQGIYVCGFNANNGQISTPQDTAQAIKPLFLAMHPKGGFIYAVGNSTLSDGKIGENIHAFSISADTGMLTFLNQIPSGGGVPCHITIDKLGTYALVANYIGGTVAVFRIRQDGFLENASCVIQHHSSSKKSSRQESPHPHSIILDKDNRFAFVADLGLDQIVVYRFSADTGLLVPHDPPSVSLQAGSGPRHFIFHSDGQYAFSINELSNTITVFQYNVENGVLSETQMLSLIPDNWSGQTYASEIQIHPSGRYVYASNRGHDSIVVFEFDPNRGLLKLIQIVSCGGKWPEHFCVDPTGKWMIVANRQSSNIVVFRINAGNGELMETEYCLELPSPSNIQCVPS